MGQEIQGNISTEIAVFFLINYLARWMNLNKCGNAEHWIFSSTLRSFIKVTFMHRLKIMLSLFCERLTNI